MQNTVVLIFLLVWLVYTSSSLDVNGDTINDITNKVVRHIIRHYDVTNDNDDDDDDDDNEVEMDEDLRDLRERKGIKTII